jgi:hypothetical protein
MIFIIVVVLLVFIVLMPKIVGSDKPRCDKELGNYRCKHQILSNGVKECDNEPKE